MLKKTISKTLSLLLATTIIFSNIGSGLTYCGDLSNDIKTNIQKDIEEDENENIIDEDIVSSKDDSEDKEEFSYEDIENDENEIIPDDFSEEEVEVIDSSDEEEIVEEEILDIDEENTEEDITETELVETELTVDIENYTVIATGNMPENAELTVSIIEDTVDLENQVNEALPEFEKFTVYKAFNIDILVDGEKWQPVDFDELVSISIKNIDISEIKEELFTDEVVYNSVTEEIEELTVETVNDTVFRVENEEITELSLTENDDEVVFETEHFTTFVYGGTSYDTTSATTTYTAGDDITAYWFESDKVLGFIGTGDMYNWGYNSYPWYSIRNYIKSVYFDDRITSIGNYAFYGKNVYDGCTSLALSGSLPDSLTSIGEGAFSNCIQLALSGTLPSGLTSIGKYAFDGCSRLAFAGSLPSGLTSIDERAFSDCANLALTGELPSGLTTIGANAFSDCTNLALTGELPSGLTTIGVQAFSDCTNLALTGELPSGLTTIGSYAFYNCTNLALTSELPSGLTTIGVQAFSDCTNLALTGDLPTSVTSIGDHAFFNVDTTKTHFDKNLSSVSITSSMDVPTSYTIVDTFTDSKPNVTTTKYDYVGATAYVGTAPTYSGYALKTDCTDTTITIGSTDTDRLALTRVYKAKVFTYNGKDYYDTDATTTYTAGDNITAYWYADDGVLGFVGTGAMYDWEYNTYPWYSIKSNITDVYLSDEITTLGDSAFHNCTSLALTSELPSGLTSIGQAAFKNCTNLALSGELPSGLTSIGSNAFYCCRNLALTGKLPSGLVTIDNSAFQACDNLALTGELPSGLTTIGQQAFNSCYKLALSGSLPNNLTSIGSEAFYNCTNLALSGTLPSGLTSIGGLAFSNCTKLALTGSLPSGLTEIGNYAFSGCTNLALSGSLPAGLTSLGNGVFQACTNLALSGELPSGLTSIGDVAFNGCTNLALSGELPSSLTSIGDAAFQVCNNLALTGSLPSGLTTIGEQAFCNCEKLVLTGDIPASVTSIGTNAFYGVDTTKTYFDNNLSSVSITSAMYVPTSYTVVDTFTDGTATRTTTKYGYVGETSSVGTAPTYEGYTLKTDCTDATITIGSTDADRLTLTRVYDPDLPEGCIKKWEIGKPTLSDVIAYLYYKNGTDNTDGYKIVWEGTGATNTFASDHDNQNQPWKSYMSEIVEVEIKEGVTVVDTNAFYECTNLKTVSLPTTMNTLANYAFRFCTNLEKINLPEGLERMGEGVFNDDTSLKNITLPSTLLIIGRAAFQYSGISGDIVIPNNTNVIGSVGFQFCDNITTFTFPELAPNIKRTVSDGVLENCKKLTDVTITSSYNEILEDAMTYNPSLKRIHLNNVTLNTDYTIMTKDAGVPCTWYRANGDEISVLEAGTLYNETIYRDAYTVTFIDYKGETIDTRRVVDGFKLNKNSLPTVPVRHYDSNADYTFKEWVLNGYAFDFDTAITEDITLVASYYEPIHIYLSAGEGYYENKNTGSHIDTIDFYVTPSKSLTIALPTNWKEAQRFGYELQGYGYGTSETYSILPFTKNEIDIPNGGDMIFEAIWGDPVEYSLSYNYGDGETPLTPNVSSYTVKNKVVIDKIPKAPEHYKLLGFTATLTDGTPVLPNATYPLSWNEGTYAQDMIITAEYTNKDVYKVTVWEDKANNKKFGDIYAEEGTSISSVNMPDKTGYTLLGFKDIDGNNITFPYKPDSDTEIEAVWSKNPVAKFNAGNGIFANKEHKIDVPTDSDGKVLSTPIPTYKGHTFSHWEIDGVPFNPETDTIASDKEVIAIWSANDVVFNFFDANNTVFRTYVLKYGDNVASKVSVPTPKKTGYTFTGWNNTVPTTAETDIDFYPNFRINTYTIKFVDALDGTTISNKTYTYGSTVDIPTAPVHTGYIFTTWSPAVAKVSEDATYKAIYSHNSYVVKFKDYDGELISLKVYNSGDRISIPDDPTRDGYIFDGWSPEVSKTATHDVTYKATYTKKEVVLTPETIKPDVSPLTPIPTTVTPTPEVKEETNPKTPVEDDEPIEINIITPDESDNEIPEPITIEAPKKTFKISFKDEKGNVISSKYYKDGEKISYPEAPVKEGYEFKGWTPKTSDFAIADAEYKAVYKESEKEPLVEVKAPEPPAEEPKTPKLVPALVTGVVTTGILAVGYFSGLWLFLLNLLFLRRRKKWHGILFTEDSKYVKYTTNLDEDILFILDIWDKSEGNVNKFYEDMMNLKSTTLLPVGTKMYISVGLGDDVETFEYNEADEQKFYDTLREYLDSSTRVILTLSNEKCKLEEDIIFDLNEIRTYNVDELK